MSTDDLNVMLAAWTTHMFEVTCIQHCLHDNVDILEILSKETTIVYLDASIIKQLPKGHNISQRGGQRFCP